jgi:Zn-finger nucleic acid-binding protein
MSDPYRDMDMFECPACGQELRAYYKRLCCDACTGIFITIDDLREALADHASAAAGIGFLDGPVGKRACPRCREPMTTCRLDAAFSAAHALPDPELDRCAKHGVWFDVGELAKALEAARHATEPPPSSPVVDLARTVVEMWDYRKR